MSQSLVCLYVHLVFSTKDRRPMITPEIRSRLYGYIGSVLRAKRARLIRPGATRDHVHLLASLGKQVSISDAVRDIKSKTSGWIHREFPKLRKFAWQGGYAAFSVSTRELEHVISYIDSQDEHHRRKSFQEELRTLLNIHNVDFDESHIWD